MAEENSSAAADAVAATTAGDNEASGDEPKLSKNQLKKLAKGKDKKKEKPQWGTGKKKEVKKKEAPKQEPFVNPTPKGEKKDMSKIPFAEAYFPTAVEAGWQDWWETAGFYQGDPAKAMGRPEDERFIMVIPPPNVTGSLHLGHALTAAVEDTLTRWHRMKGHATLYVPGTDHAGIATQSVVEKMLMKNENKTRHDLGREAFVQKVWEWKGEYGTRITNQLRRLGSSVDWSRERFTMDDMLSKAVVEAFNRFHEKGLLYRANRLGNWSCALKSAISDIEVDYIDLEGRTFLEVKTHKGNPNDPKGRYEFGVLTSFAYPIEDSDEVLVVATTRLETMLGDTAVAVHPEDPRYKHLHGKHVIHPFSGRKIPIITDPELVDMSFGTGAVKITPAHDPNDYECGKRHNLEFITVLTEDGAINHYGGPEFEGMMRYDARIAMEEALDKKGLLRGKEPNKMRLGLCSRSGDILEPMITPQWYVNCDSMAKRSTDAVRNGELKIIPAEHEKTWFQWLDNIRDWCVSRQLWWGHQIPAWFAKTKAEGDEIQKNDIANNDRWIVARNEDEAKEKAMKFLGCSEDELVLERDEDVLDTWFSSGLFPFSVMGWPDNTEDLKAFYPTSLLETGLDILFFWVARMVMMGLELTDQLPFHTVFLHAMVRDKEGRKMSKSLGNVIDPLEVIGGCSLEALQERLEGGNLPEKEIARAKKNNELEFPDGIPECGSDALRFGLLAYTVQGRDINLDVKRVVGYRNFCNKMWNTTKFALTYVDDFKPTPTLLEDLMASNKMAIRDKFMISRLMKGIEAVNVNFSDYKFGDAQQAAYQLWLNDMCDVYLEAIKPIVGDRSKENEDARWAAQATLWVALEAQLRLLHPMMPFITEELWQRLPGRGTLGDGETPSIMLAKYPECNDAYKNEQVEEAMATILEIVKACRSLRSSYNIVPKNRTHFYIKISEGAEVAQAQADDIMTLGNGSKVDINVPDEEIPTSVGTIIVNDSITLLVDLKGMVDFKTEIGRLNKNLKKARGPMEQLQMKIASDGYAENVPEDLKKSNEEKLEGLKKQVSDMEEAIANFERLLSLEDN
ncbi:valyl-tRNA synthetase [Nitzschia inconspicua]|uniref:valine--tRNA ligase n=1 Tax=Nitzschia inconspicua TaxID=303405 RepID=A0A9K3KFI5_9STRA|nr:valyl-tRNA synthetase [Nitzschia inconspicua]